MSLRRINFYIFYNYKTFFLNRRENGLPCFYLDRYSIYNFFSISWPGCIIIIPFLRSLAWSLSAFWRTDWYSQIYILLVHTTACSCNSYMYTVQYYSHKLSWQREFCFANSPQSQNSSPWSSGWNWPLCFPARSRLLRAHPFSVPQSRAGNLSLVRVGQTWSCRLIQSSQPKKTKKINGVVMVQGATVK